MASKISQVLLLACVIFRIGQSQITLASLAPSDITPTGHDDSSAQEVRRFKRSLTTICVEIKPSRPQDEPYFMCKGAEFPASQKTSKLSGSSETSYNPHSSQQPSSYFQSGTNGGGSNFQRPAQLYDNKSQYSSSSTSNNAPFQPGSSYASNAYNAPPTTTSKIQQQPFRGSKTPFQALKAATTSYDQTQANKQSYYSQEEPTPTQSSYTQSTTGYASKTATSDTQAQLSKPTSAYQGNAYETQSTYGNSDYGAHTNGAVYSGFGDGGSTSVYQPKSVNRGGSYAQSTNAATHAAAVNEKSSPAKTVLYAHANAPSTNANEAQARNAATPTTSAYVAAKSTKSDASFLNFDAPSFGSAAYYNYGADYSAKNQQLLPGYQPNNRFSSYSDQAAPLNNYQQAGVKPPNARYRAMLDDDTLGEPKWGFLPEEFEHFQTFSSPVANADHMRALTMPILVPQMPDLPQARSMPPLEHLDDPVMQQFYASLHDTPTHNVFRTATSNVNESPLLGASYASQPMQPFQRIYSQPEVKTPTCTHTAAAPPIYQPSTATGHCCSNTAYPATNTASYVPTTTANPYGNHYQPPCSSQREHNYQPVFIALPCYDQQQQKQPANNGDSNLGMALPNIFHRPAFPGLGFMNPLSPFAPPSLLGSPIGIFSNLQSMQSPQLATQSPYYLWNMGAMTTPPAPAAANPTHTEGRKANGDNIEAPKANTATVTANPTTAESNESHDDSTEDKSDEAADELEQSSQDVKQDAKQEEYESTTELMKTATKPSGDSKPTKQIEAMPPLNNDYIPPKLEEESRKTFKTMLDAAKTFSEIAKSEVPVTVVTPATTFDATVSRLEKRQNIKPAVANVSYKRKYMQLV